MKNKEGNFRVIGIVMFITMIIAFLWDQLTWIKGSVHAILNPTAGALLDWNLTLGMLIIVAIISLLTTLVQKYATDQKALKELKKEQKILQEEMKKFKEHPEKLMQLQKKQFEFLPKTMKLSMRAIIYTGIPFVLFFRWFNDYFMAIPDFRFFGFFSWFWFYLIFTLVFSSILKKYLDVV
jgi:uncharacterized membrane protein (DUF106 family)